MREWEIQIYWSEEDKLYIAEIPELKGFFADGKTMSEAIHNAEIVLAEWLEVAREDGIPIPKVKNKVVFRKREKRSYSKVMLNTILFV